MIMIRGNNNRNKRTKTFKKRIMRKNDYIKELK